jgi:hypothetical protein
MAVLERNSRRKAAVTGKGVDVLLRHRADISEDVHWAVAGARFFVATITRGPTMPRGVVFEADDGSRLVLAKAGTRAQAGALAAAAGTNAVVLQIQPSWGMPAKDWIAVDSDFWRPNPSAATR